MVSVIAKTMLESSIAAADWVLSCQQIRKPERYEEIFKKLYSSFSENRADEDIYRVLLTVLDDVFDILAEGQLNGTLTAGRQAAPGGNAELKIEVEKTIAELLREAEDFFMFLLVFANTLDVIAESAGRPGGAHTYEVISTLASVPQPSSEVKASEQPRPLFEEFRLKIMMCGFDFFSSLSPYRHKACIQIAEFAAQHGLFQKLSPYKSHMQQWIQKDPHITSANRRYLYGIIASELQKQKKMDKQIYPLLLHIVEEFDKNETQKEDSAAVQAAVDLVVLAIALTDVVTFDNLIQSKTVQDLSSTPHAPLLQLAHIFCNGDHKDFLEFQKQHPGIFEAYGLDDGACFDKIKLLGLASLASSLASSASGSTPRTPRLSLKDVAKYLDLSLSEAESLVVRAISLGILNGQIDQMTSEVAIRSSLQRSFERLQWVQLAQRLIALNRNVTQVIAHLEKNANTNL